MDKSIQGYLGSLRIGEVQQFKNLAMVPVISDYDDGLGYITLGEAIVDTLYLGGIDRHICTWSYTISPRPLAPTYTGTTDSKSSSIPHVTCRI